MKDERPPWKLPDDAVDWECDWESSRRFQLNYWAGLSLQEIIEALEEMAEMAEKLTPDAVEGATMAREEPPSAPHR